MTIADFLLPYVLGILTVLGPQVYIYIRALRREIIIMKGPAILEEETK